MCELKQCSACDFSANAFGNNTINAVSPPEWWFKNKTTNVVEAIQIAIPPYTACTWCYEAMYGDDVATTWNQNSRYDNDVRFKNAKKYFDQFEENKSLVFYYTGYSNPFSDGEEQNYVIVGISRIKK